MSDTRGFPEPVLVSVLERAGLDCPREGASVLRRILEYPDWGDRRSPFLGHLEAGLRVAGGPDRALVTLHRFLEVQEERDGWFRLWCDRPATLSLFVRACGLSQHVSELLVCRPGAYEALCKPGFLSTPRTETDLEDALRSALAGQRDPRARLAAIRRFRRRDLLRVAVRDLVCGSPSAELVVEMSALADVCLRAGYDAVVEIVEGEWGRPGCRDGGRAGMAVIAVGKLGGRELNYSSDVDLMFVYEGEGETDGGARSRRISNHEYYNRLASEFVRAVTEKTEDGWLYRVDTRLRPEGESGPLAQPLGACEAYYGARAETWERLALTKARPCAGSRGLGEAFLEIAEGFVYGPFGVERIVDDVAAVRQRIEDELEAAAAGADPPGRVTPEGGAVGLAAAVRDVKLSRGGIREIEFIVQTLLIVHGRDDHRLRCRSTAEGIARLREAGVLGEERAAALAEAYWFLRTVEHRLQMDQEVQTHVVPAEGPGLERLAVGLDFGSVAEFEDAWRRRREFVREFYSEIFPVSGVGISPLARMVQEGRAVRLAEWLEQRRFSNPARAAEAILSLALGSGGSHVARSTTERFVTLLPSLLDMAGDLGEPDRALIGLERLVGRYGARAAIFDLVAGQPRILEILLELFDRSRAMTDIVIDRPELMEELILQARFGTRKPSVMFRRELAAALRGVSELDGAMERARRYRAEEFLRIGLGDILGVGESPALSSEMSDLADACLRCGVEWIGRSVEAAAGEIAIVALGKSGGREIGYGADLDVLFVAEGGTADTEARVKAAAGLIDFMGRHTSAGRLFALDARLRPYGADGPLVTDLDALSSYYRDTAQLWERQALVKARVLLGPAAFRERLQDRLRELAYAPGLDAAGVAAIHEMRNRIERERVKPGSDARAFKTGAGGLVDVEFLVQMLQLRHGLDEPAVRATSTLEALDACGGAGWIPAANASVLADGYRFLRRVEGAVRIEDDASTSELPAAPGRLLAVARCLGYPTTDAFEEELSRRRAEIRAIYASVVASLGGS